MLKEEYKKISDFKIYFVIIYTFELSKKIQL